MYMSGVGDMPSDHHHIDSMRVSNLLTLPSQMMPQQKGMNKVLSTMGCRLVYNRQN